MILTIIWSFTRRVYLCTELNWKHCWFAFTYFFGSFCWLKFTLCFYSLGLQNPKINTKSTKIDAYIFEWGNLFIYFLNTYLNSRALTDSPCQSQRSSNVVIARMWLRYFPVEESRLSSRFGGACGCDFESLVLP